MKKLLGLLIVLSFGCTPGNKKNVNRENSTFPVIIDTDLGGDPDDIQSLYRLVQYSDILKVNAIVSTPCSQMEQHPWDTIENSMLIKEWIKRIDPDHLRENGFTDLMSEQDLLNTVVSGSSTPGPPADYRKTLGSERIAEIAKEYSPENPIWLLVWGSTTTLAQTLYDHPDIAPNIRIYSIASSNTQHDSLSRNFIYEFMKTSYPDLWWIENGVLPKWEYETFRGVYQGGVQEGEWAADSFIHYNIRGHGSTNNGLFRKKCGDVFPVANWPKNILKEGDSPSMLFLLSPRLGNTGNVDDPTQESWGGQFRNPYPDKYPNYYCDLDLPSEKCQETISKWRVFFLRDWKSRWDRYHKPA